MSQVTNVFGTNDDQEILTSLYTIVNVSVGAHYRLSRASASGIVLTT